MMKSSKEMAEIWNVSERTVTTFCKSGKVPGAIKEEHGRYRKMQRNRPMVVLCPVDT